MTPVSRQTSKKKEKKKLPDLYICTGSWDLLLEANLKPWSHLLQNYFLSTQLLFFQKRIREEWEKQQQQEKEEEMKRKKDEEEISRREGERKKKQVTWWRRLSNILSKRNFMLLPPHLLRSYLFEWPMKLTMYPFILIPFSASLVLTLLVPFVNTPRQQQGNRSDQGLKFCSNRGETPQDLVILTLTPCMRFASFQMDTKDGVLKMWSNVSFSEISWQWRCCTMWKNDRKNVSNWITFILHCQHKALALQLFQTACLDCVSFADGSSERGHSKCENGKQIFNYPECYQHKSPCCCWKKNQNFAAGTVSCDYLSITSYVLSLPVKFGGLAQPNSSCFLPWKHCWALPIFPKNWRLQVWRQVNHSRCKLQAKKHICFFCFRNFEQSNGMLCPVSEQRYSLCWKYFQLTFSDAREPISHPNQALHCSYLECTATMNWNKVCLMSMTQVKIEISCSLFELVNSTVWWKEIFLE